MNYRSLLCLLCIFCSFPILAESEKHHFPGIFLGNTHVDGENITTLGLEYEYRFTANFGVGAAYERLNDAHHGDGADLFAGQFFYHPTTHIKLGLGYGQERIGGNHGDHEFFYRISAAYEYAVKPLEIEPTIDFDILDGKTAVVLGVAIVMPF